MGIRLAQVVSKVYTYTIRAFETPPTAHVHSPNPQQYLEIKFLLPISVANSIQRCRAFSSLQKAVQS